MRFLTLLDPQSQPVSGLDDALFVNASRGVFYLADTGNNRVLAITVEGLDGELFASVGSIHAFVTVNTKTGIVTPVVKNLNGPHGLAFVPRSIEDDGGDR